MKPLVSARLPTDAGDFEVHAFESGVSSQPHLMLCSKKQPAALPLVRVHSECWTGDVMGSLRCDCGPQLDSSLKQVQKEGGAVLYLRQEGRGIGLVEKLKAYNLQDEGLDTYEANERLGHQRDARRFDVAAEMLASRGWTAIRLLTNNPDKVYDLEKEGIEVREVVALEMPPNEHNAEYLSAKAKEVKQGHTRA
ncbi:MAG: GTP cyclohydrolase II [Flavobacteriales bacterium]|nr:GTP cyclohydrolase II [Flavobacteriales bacterium]|tara:strand:+ start:932 stop:1513 length:582 start_codon:yes stop_codon:yes gene_type:complete